MSTQNPLVRFYHKVGLVPQIVIGLIAGIILAAVSTEGALRVSILGELFVNALKSVAPILVLVLVSASITAHKKGKKTNIKQLIVLYFASMIAAALVAVFASFMFPSKISLLNGDSVTIAPPSGIGEVLRTLLLKMIDNPFNALINANYIGLIVWGVGLGMALRHGSETTKNMMADLSYALSFIVKIIIRFAPLGVFGLVASTLAQTGFAELQHYLHLLIVLVACMVIVALIINPLLAFIAMRKNPYPLVFASLKESGIPAFFTRSSAANIPVNLALCKKLNLDEDVYSVAIPLGATINMSGAAVTITTLTLAAVYSLGIPVDIYSAILLCVVSAVCACGASGIAGGSLLLIPIACSLFGIPNEVAVNVIAIGIAIGVVQDSFETAINSSSDVVFVGAICQNLPAKTTASEAEII